MKKLTLFLLVTALANSLMGQATVENVIIITTDGLRWQEVFKGMDSAIGINRRFNQRDSLYIFNNFWHADVETRRKKLMPFMWSKIAADGSVYGNRDMASKVDLTNPYWFSYPGYSELLSGHADTLINSNSYPDNPNVTLLEFLNKQPAFKGRVAAFTAWEAFNRIINERRSGIPVIAAFDTVPQPTAKQALVNQMLKASFKPWGKGECLDVFTHFAAMEYLKLKKPKILYIAYGETDEWAHAGEYRNYLNATHQFDNWLNEIWTYLQSNAQYRGKTALFIASDHGRGDENKDEWTSHGSSIIGANQTWFAVLSPAVKGKGEAKNHPVIFQSQFAQTIASFLGVTYKAAHPIGNGLKL
jgi:hypothetical protein